MAKLLWIVVIYMAAISCNEEYRTCDKQTDDESLKAYNDILTEIVSKRSYNLYLGEDEELIFNKYSNERADSGEIEKEVIRLHNKLFNDSSRFCTIYLDTTLGREFDKWAHFKKGDSRYRIKIRDLIMKFSDSGQAVIDSLNSRQERYFAQDFSLCIASIKSLRELGQDRSKCYIGKIGFSKLLFNKTREKGLLYYEFHCGELCGYGALINIGKKNNRWIIDESVMIWIS